MSLESELQLLGSIEELKRVKPFQKKAEKLAGDLMVKKRHVKQVEAIFTPARQVVINVPNSVNYRLKPTKGKIYETAIERANMRIAYHSLVEVG